jgi:hypothetical protein
MLRAHIGQIVLDQCGISSELKIGAMLYRVGPHRRRDTLRFCQPNNLGGYRDDAYLCGHAWLRVNDDIVDFSTGDWHQDANALAEMELDDLGSVEWKVVWVCIFGSLLSSLR